MFYDLYSFLMLSCMQSIWVKEDITLFPLTVPCLFLIENTQEGLPRPLIPSPLVAFYNTQGVVVFLQPPLRKKQTCLSSTHATENTRKISDFYHPHKLMCIIKQSLYFFVYHTTFTKKQHMIKATYLMCKAGTDYIQYMILNISHYENGL